MDSLFSQWTDSVFFGIALTLVTYAAGLWTQRRFPSPLVNPLIIAVILCTLVLKLLRIPYAHYDQGARLITLLMLPATLSLALPIYRNIAFVKRYLPAILAGCAAGAATSVGVVYGLSRLLGLDTDVLFTLLPKSVTTPIAVELSARYGGIPSLTVAAVVLTGMTTAVFAPLWLKLFKVKQPLAAGLAIGTSGHAIGTSYAMQLGQEQGAASGVAMSVTGILTSLLFLLLF